jgi:hypothetical protein
MTRPGDVIPPRLRVYALRADRMPFSVAALNSQEAIASYFTGGWMSVGTAIFVALLTFGIGLPSCTLAGSSHEKPTLTPLI